MPPAVSSAGAEAALLAERAGLVLDPWQRLVLDGALGERADCTWAAFEVGLVVPRQNGKGSILEALELFALFLPTTDGPPPLILHSAHEFKTSAEHFRRMRDLVEGSEFLRRQVRIIRTAAGSESIELHSGARLRFVTRTSGSGRGFSADLIVLDEAYNLTAESIAAVLPTLSARPNPQLWYTSSAGMDSSEQLARVRQRGTAGTDRRLAYFEWSAEDGSDLDDRDAWSRANPALGIRISEEFVEQERQTLPDEQFARERLGLWADTNRKQSPLNESQWALGATMDPPGDPVVFGISRPRDQSYTSIVACGMARGRPVVELVKRAAGSEWAVEWLTSEDRTTRPVVWMNGNDLATGLIPALEQGGLVVQQTNSREYAAACAQLVDAVTQDRFGHRPHPDLDAAVRAAQTRNLGDMWAWSSKGAATDISPLVAATVALHGHATTSSEGPNLW